MKKFLLIVAVLSGCMASIPKSDMVVINRVKECRMFDLPSGQAKGCREIIFTAEPRLAAEIDKQSRVETAPSRF